MTSNPEPKSYSIFKRMDQQNHYYENPLGNIVKRYSRSHIDELSDSGNNLPLATTLNLKELSIFIDDRRCADDRLVEQPNSPSKIARRQFTEEFDREQSPRKLHKALIDQREEQLLFNEKIWVDDQSFDPLSFMPRIRSDSELESDEKDKQAIKLMPSKIKSARVESDKPVPEEETLQLQPNALSNTLRPPGLGLTLPSWARKANSSSTSFTNQDGDPPGSRVC